MQHADCLCKLFLKHSSMSNPELSLDNMQTCYVIKLSHQSCTHLLPSQVVPSFCDGLLQLHYRSMVSFAQAGFIEQPEVVDFEVSVMGGPTLAGLIPSLKAWLIRFARDAIISHYVLPEQWCFRLDPVTHTLPHHLLHLRLHCCSRKHDTVLAHLKLSLLAFLVVVHHIHT